MRPLALGNCRRLCVLVASPRRYLSAAATAAKPVEQDDERAIYTLGPIDPNEEKFDKILIANRGEIACR